MKVLFFNENTPLIGFDQACAMFSLLIHAKVSATIPTPTTPTTPPRQIQFVVEENDSI